MKAITLTQPWASLVAIGAKQWETRSWPTKYRGRVAIHAAKGFPKRAQDFYMSKACIDVFLPVRGYVTTPSMLGWDELPLGAVIATCELTACLHTESVVVNMKEHPFGDFSSGRYCFRLEDVVLLPEPIPAKGMLGLWEWQP